MTPAAAFVRDVRTHAAAAEAAATEAIERWYRIGGLLLHIRFLGDALLPLIDNAIGHRAVPPSGEPPALHLRCWDCASLGQPFPAAPVPRQAFTPRGEIPALTDARHHVAFEAGGRLLSVMDCAVGEALYCVGDAAGVPRFDAAEPIRILLSWFMRAHGRQLMHAGAVGTDEGGVLLVGRSGAGKSNTALTCLNGGLGYVADDFCAVSAEGTPTAYSLYSTAKTRAADAARNPFLHGLAPDLDPEGRDKTIYYLHRAAPERLIESFPIRAILLVQRGGEDCRVEPLPAAAALAASAPDTAMLLPDARGEVLRTLGRLVRGVPCYTLHLGPDPRRITPMIGALLADLAAARAV